MLLKSPQKTMPVEGLGSLLPAALSPALSQYLEKGRPLWSLPPDRDRVPPLRPHLRSREGAKKVISDSEELAVPHHRAVPLCAVQRCPAETSAAPLCSPCFLEPLSHPRSFTSLSVITKAWRKLSGQAGERSLQASCLGLDSPAMPFCSLQPDTCTEHQ